MAIKIFSILLALFSIGFVAISIQDPYFLELKSYSINFKNIEAKNLIASELNSTSVKSIYKANMWIRYQEKDVFKDFLNINQDYNISANTLEFFYNKNNKLFLSGDVIYINDDNTKITSDEVYYYTDSKILTSNLGFKAYLNNNLIIGKILNYDMKNKILKIKGVNAWLEEK